MMLVHVTKICKVYFLDRQHFYYSQKEGMFERIKDWPKFQKVGVSGR